MAEYNFDDVIDAEVFARIVLITNNKANHVASEKFQNVYVPILRDQYPVLYKNLVDAKYVEETKNV